MNTKIKCCCQISFNKYAFEEHFIKCESFKEKFKEFDNKLSLLLKDYNNIEDLNYIKYLLKSFIKLIDYKIKESKGSQIKKKDSFIEKIMILINLLIIIIQLLLMMSKVKIHIIIQNIFSNQFFL